MSKGKRKYQLCHVNFDLFAIYPMFLFNVCIEQLDTLHGQVNSLRQELSMASHELTGVQSSDAKIRSELAMCEQQMGQLKRNNVWLNDELQKTTKEFNEYRREKVHFRFLSIQNY